MAPLARKIVIVLSALVFAYVAIGYVLAKSSDDKTYRSLTVFSEVYEHIQRDYVEDPDLKKVTTGALHGLLESLDPQSSYLSPREFADYEQRVENKTKGEGGAALSKRGGFIVVVSVMPDSPAQKAGLHTGDILESIAGFTTSQMAISQAQVLLTGDSGSTVKLSVIPRGHIESHEVNLPLAKVPPARLLEGHFEADVAYLRVPSFVPGMAKQIRDKLVQMDREGAHKLIFDLRDCALGDVEEGVATAQLFLPAGIITTLKGQTVEAKTFSADPAKVVWKMPLAVLISSGTAGPSEVFAAAIADNHRGETLGDRTFGTASFQKVIQLDDGAALILTAANYYTPAGKSIPAEGVNPSVTSPSSEDQLANDLGATMAPPPGQVASPDDPVVKKALEILQAPQASRKAA